MSKPTEHEKPPVHPPPVPAAAAAAKKEPVSSQSLHGGAGTIVRFKLNGMMKSISIPAGQLTGADLYRLAGQPQKLVTGSGHQAIANDSEPVAIADGDEFTATY